MLRPTSTVWLLFCSIACSGKLSEGESVPGSGAAPAAGTAAAEPSARGGAGGVANAPAGAAPLACTAGPRDPGPSVMRRLTRREYNNTVSDLLGDNTAPASSWLAEPAETSFDNDGTAQALSRQHVEQFRLTAADVAARAVATRLDAIAPCADPVAEAGACADRFIEQFGGRAFRRPLTSAEVDILRGVYAHGQATTGYARGIELVLETVLQSVQFLYLPEFGVGQGEQLRLSGFEIATRLSHYLWSTTPDEALQQAATNGTLDTNAGVREQAERLLRDARALPTLQHFYVQWLRLADLPLSERSPELYPEFNANVADSMLRGTRAFVSEMTLGGSYRDLMTSRTVYVDATSAPLYGLDAVGLDSELVPRPSPMTERAGLLTELSVLTAHSGYSEHSPITRGVFIRENVMCSPPPPPPPGAAFENPATDPNLTTRERFELHRADPGCASCHALFDVIGLGFENYDSIGRYRAEENGKAIDPRGQVVAYDGTDREFTGATEFAEILASSPEAKSCFVTQWFRFANGRMESKDDACALQDLYTKFEQADFNIRELVLGITESEAFLYRRNIAPEECSL